MKKACLTLFTLMLMCLFCSCSTQGQKDTFFVHAVCFDGKADNVTVTFLLEKHKKDNNEYFTATYSQKSITKAAEKVMSEYTDCYFATCDLYFISRSADSKAISSIAKDICDSNVYPTTARIVCINSDTTASFMDNIKNAEVIEKIKKDSEENKTNVVTFFAKFYSKKPVTIDTFSMNEEKIVKEAKATFIKDRKAVLHEVNKR